MKEVVIVSTARTPFGKFGGGLKGLSASDLGGLAIQEALKRANISGKQVDEVVEEWLELNTGSFESGGF